MSLSSQIRYVRALDSAATDGSGKTGLAFGDFTAKYLVEGGTLTSLTTETITTLGTYQAPTSAAHVRVKELSSSDPCKGVYEVHLHNTQVAVAGARLWLFLSASGAAIQPLELDLITTAALPSAAANANGGLPVLSVNGTTLAYTVTNLTNAPTAGDFTATMKTSLNAATPASVQNVAAQTGDSYARLGAPAGASVSADVAAVKSETDTILTDVNTGGGAIYTRIGAPAGASLAADVAAAKTDTAAIKAKTDNLPASPAAVGSAMALVSAYDFAKGTVAVTEAYAANGVAPTPVQALLAIHQYLMDFTIAATSYTVKKLDNIATAFVVTLNDATTPTGAART